MASQKSFTSTIDIIARLKPDEVLNSAKKISEAFANMNPSKEIQKQFSATLTGFAEALNRYKLKIAQGINTNADFKDLLSNGTQILKLYDKLSGKAEGLKNLTKDQYRGFFPEETRKKVVGMEKAINDYDAAIKKNSRSQAAYKGIITNNSRAIEANKKAIEGLNKAVIVSDKEYEELNEDVKNASIDYANAIRDAAEAQEKLKAAQEGKSQPNKSSTVRQLKKEAEEAERAAQEAQKNLTAAQNNLNGKTTEALRERDLKRLNDELGIFGQKIEDAKTKLKELETTNTAFVQLQATFKNLGIDINSIDDARNALSSLEGTAKRTAVEGIDTFLDAVNNVSKPVGDFKNDLHGAADSFSEFNQQMKMSNEINRKVTQFFTAANAIRLFRRAVTSAFNTVKELDAAMTATAVVTDFDLDDLWGQMPKYTAQANKLGVAIKDVVEAQTLFYQQGLKTQQVEELSTQALKMARIAGLDAADATNKMTAALRGFNMELNQASAQNVADVYSQLAAITASDVEEISSAMTKTASIAHSAGMQFETTAAFLSQIIETTRESAETAGTALKTVIARFQELKKSPDEIGEVDGEIVDANKIEGALRTVGVSLRDANGQFRELDQVFLELSSKWDSLDKNTQRYIATIAAGSRQQSRFIAMMSDYKRTQDLVAAANNSAGAANRQYEKTLDSLDAKLKQLKNAWDEFTTGITNSTLIKGAVDMLTLLLKTINKTTGVLPGVGGSFLKLSLAIGTLKGGGKIVSMFNGFNKTLGPTKALSATAAKTINNLGTSIKFAFSEKNFSKDTFTNFTRNFNGLNQQILKGNKEFDKATGAIRLLNSETTTLTEQEQLYNTVLGLTNDRTRASAMLNLDSATAQAANAHMTSLGADATAKLAYVEELEAMQSKSGIAARISATWALLTSNGAKKAAAMVTLGLISAEEGEALATGTAETAQWNLNAAIYACPLGWILIIIVAVVAALAALAVALYKASDAAKMEELDNSIQRINEDLSNTKQALDDVVESQQKLQTLNDSFEGLAEGTSEWRKALYESNQEVMELVKKYPILAKYVDRDSNGKLSISDTGWDVLNKSLEDKQALLLQEMNIATEAQERLTYDNTANKLEREAKIVKGIFQTTDMTSLGHYETLANVGVYDQWSIQSEAGREEYLKNMIQTKASLSGEVLSDEEAQNLYDKLVAIFTDAENAITKENDRFEKSMEDYARNNADLLISSNEQAATSDYKNVLREGLTEVVKNNAEDIQSEIDSSSITPEMRKNYAESIGKTGSMTYGQAKKNGFTGSREDFKREMILYKKNRDKNKPTLEVMLDTVNELALSSSEGAKAILHLGEEGALLNDNYVKALQNLTNDEKQALKNLGLIKDITDAEAYIQKEREFYTNRKKLAESSIEGSGINLDDDLFLGAVEGLAQHFAIIMAENGQDAAIELNNSLNEILATLSIDEKNAFVQTLNGVKWKDLDSWEGFKDSLAEAGITNLNEGLDDFIESAQKAAHAIKLLKFETVEENITKLAKVARDVREGVQGTTFDEQMYEDITKNNPNLKEDFTLTIDGQYEFTSSMDKLRETLNSLIFVELEQLKQQTEAKIAAGERLNNVDADLFDTEGSSEFLRNNLQELYDSLGYSFNKDLLQIEGISNAGIEWDKLSPAQMRAAIEALSNLRGNNLDTNKIQLDTINGQLTSFSQQSQRVTTTGVDTFMGTANNRTLIAMLQSMGASDAGIEQYKQKLKELGTIANKDSEAYKNLWKETKMLERNLVNDTSLKQANERMGELFSKLKDNTDAYENLTDEASRWQKLQDSASAFGLYLQDADAANEFASNLTKVLDEGSEEAYLNLVSKAAEAAGLDFEGSIEEAFSNGIENGEDQWIKFAEKLSEAGLAVFTDEYDKESARLRTEPELKMAAEEYGHGRDYHWENPYTWLYNINQRINRQIKDREAAERAYNRAVEDSVKTTQDLVASSKRELDLLAGQQKMYEYRTQNAQDELKKWRDGEYGKYFNFDSETGRYLGVKPEVIKEVENGKRPDIVGENIETVEARLQEIQDAWDEGNEELENIDDQVKEIRNRGREQYVEFEKRVLSNLVSYYTQQIDELETIGQTIEDTNSKLISSIQETVAKQRQERQNQETEQNLSDKQRRLAYLQMDTSGANATEILKLQDELAKDQQSYTDTLVDQAIDEMQKANQVAQEQREQQISIMRSQLQYAQDSGALWGRVEELMNLGLDENGLKVDSELVTLFKTQEGWASLSEIQQQDWMDSLKNDAKLAELFRSKEILEYLQTSIGDFTKEGVDPLKTLRSIPEAISSAAAETNGNLGKILQEMQKEPPEQPKGEKGSRIVITAEMPQNSLGGSKGLGTTVGSWGLKITQMEYATGGLADFTGPAWLDGTPSQPELVLNSKDTQNFIALRDILSNLANNGTSIGGDTYYDIDIDVDSLQSDYDVEQLADKIRSMIAADATYRNVNTLNRLR